MPRILPRQPAPPREKVGPLLDAERGQPLPREEAAVAAHVRDDDAESLPMEEITGDLDIPRVLAVEEAVNDDDDRARAGRRRREERHQRRPSGLHVDPAELEARRRAALAGGGETLVLALAAGVGDSQRARKAALRPIRAGDPVETFPERGGFRRGTGWNRGLRQPVKRACGEREERRSRRETSHAGMFSPFAFSGIGGRAPAPRD